MEDDQIEVQLKWKTIKMKDVQMAEVQKILRKQNVYHNIWNSIGQKILVSEDRGASYPRFVRFFII